MRPSLRIEDVLEAVRMSTLIVTPHAEEAIRDEGCNKQDVLSRLSSYETSLASWDWWFKTPRLQVLVKVFGRLCMAVFARDVERPRDMLMITFTTHTPEHYRIRRLGYPDVDGSLVFDFPDAA
jgi:hypothetical protein